MKIVKLLSIWAVGVFVGGSVGCTTAAPTVQSGPDAEVSFDGLHKVDNTRVDSAWAVPDLDLTGYTEILPVNVGIEYGHAKNKGRSTARRSQGGPFFIDDEARARFEALVNEVVTEELEKSTRFSIVNEPGPNTLIVAGGLLDVISNVPPDRIGGRSYIYLNSVGAATLVLEVRDAETNKTLIRAVDRRAAETIGGTLSNTVSSTAEVRRLIRFWATRLREALEGFAQ